MVIVKDADDVQSVIGALKLGKTDGDIGLSSDFYKRRVIFQFALRFHFYAFLVYGVAPQEMLMRTWIPIPKSRTSHLTLSVNYRGRPISPTVQYSEKYFIPIIS
jgi:hypothetical protein